MESSQDTEAQFDVPTEKMSAMPDKTAPGEHNVSPAKESNPRKPTSTKVSKVLQDDEAHTQSRGTRKRKAPSRGPDSRPIPKTLADADEADRVLLTMADAGASWKSIRAKLKELTGNNTGRSTLPNRYERLKQNLINFDEEDVTRLLEAKREVEITFENEKWERIAQIVVEKKGKKYDGNILRKKHKKLLEDAGLHPPAAVQDPDFESGSE